MSIGRINPFSSAMPVQGISFGATQAANNGAVSENLNNSLVPNKNYGYGLVNSDLSNLSYKLPNGKTSICNQIGIA